MRVSIALSCSGESEDLSISKTWEILSGVTEESNFCTSVMSTSVELVFFSGFMFGPPFMKMVFLGVTVATCIYLCTFGRSVNPL